MTITEIRDALTELIDAGHGNVIMRDDNDPNFAISGIKKANALDDEGNKTKWVYFECDEVKNEQLESIAATTQNIPNAD